MQELIYKRYQDSFWGMAVYDFFLMYCMGEYQSMFGLQCFCGIYEHKVLMKKRFDFLKSNGITISDKNYHILEEIIHEAELVKNLHLVCSLRQDYTELLKCVPRIERMRELEGELLPAIAERIREGFYY